MKNRDDRKTIWVRKALINYEIIAKPFGDQRNRVLNISDNWIEYVRSDYREPSDEETRVWRDVIEFCEEYFLRDDIPNIFRNEAKYRGIIL